jgi:hypothetical protein
MCFESFNSVERLQAYAVFMQHAGRCCPDFLQILAHCTAAAALTAGFASMRGVLGTFEHNQFFIITISRGRRVQA